MTTRFDTFQLIRLIRRGFASAALAMFIAGPAHADQQTDARQSLLIPVSESESLIHPQRELMKTPIAAPKPAPAPAATFQQKHLAALDKALAGDNAGAMALLNETLKMKAPSDDERDRALLSLGRIQYQAGKFDEALGAYTQVRKSGVSWLEALEERANTLMRLGRLDDALASLKTVLAPLFADRVSPEPYYLAALAQLRTCDFRGVFRTLDIFKARYRDRLKTWEATKTMDPVARLRVKEMSETIQKLNLVEAEAIQRLYMDEAGKRMGGSPPSIAHTRDELNFPTDAEADSKEIWLDEVDAYHVTSKGCPTAKVPLQASK